MNDKDTRIAEVEYLIDSYFASNVAEVMDENRAQLDKDKAKEVAEYQRGLSGMMSSLGTGSNAALSMHSNPLDTLRHTGEHCSKTAEDFIAMCKDSLKGNAACMADLAVLAGEWRNAVIAKVGREKYNSVSEKLGCDLAFAYVENRIEQKMLDKMVSDEMPKSSVEYLLQKGVSNSFIGLAQSASKSPLQAEIEARGEAAYRPSGAEKFGAKALGFGADIATFGGVSSWGSLAKLLGLEVVFSGVDKYLDKTNPKEKAATVDEIVSQALFGSEDNVMEAYRYEGNRLKAFESQYIQAVNGRMKQEMSTIPDKKPALEALADAMLTPINAIKDVYTMLSTAQVLQDSSIGKENNTESQNVEPQKENSMSEGESDVQKIVEPIPQEELKTQEDTKNQEKAEQQSNTDGWAGLLSTTGLSGLGDIGNNLGFVLSMLPDLLFGLVSGDTKSLNRHNALMPMASILLGVFIKNPILKMMLIGYGGANLLNKVGHEVLERQDQRLGISGTQQYKRYEEEELNPRISNPAISGNSLIATIDRVPCTIALPDNVVNAYQTGALPLSTLANAILARHDQMQQMAQLQYETTQQQSQDRIIIQR